MSRKDFEAAARIIAAADVTNAQRAELAEAFADHFSTTNARFDRARFIDACGVRYCIVRMSQTGPPRKVRGYGNLSLSAAQEHCRRDDTHGTGWFHGYDVA